MGRMFQDGALGGCGYGPPMSLIEPTLSVAPDERPADLVEVGVYSSERAAFDRGLVVLAVGRPYWSETSEARVSLLVEPEIAPRVREQLMRFERENVDWPPRPLVETVTYPTDVITPLVWAAAVLAIFHFQATRPEWLALGALDAAAIFERGEWWRVGTALWLHADGAHVISNALSGIFLFTAVLKTFGRALGWLWIAVAAMLANLAIAALAYPTAYRSLGASTAIFAGLGLLTGRMVGGLVRADRRLRWRAVTVALGSGVVVLALYGAGGGAARVDVGAHVAGFVAGLALGFGLAACQVGTKKTEPGGSA
jgi:rhomboid protease GluP